MDAKTRDVLSMWTVYDNPRDMPGRFVARRFEITGGPAPVPTDDAIASIDLELIRASLRLRGLACIPRQAGDQAHIVECWI